MNAQKNKLTLVITLAIVSVFLLGGVSFTFFPSQIKPTSTPQLTISANSIDQAFVPTANSSFQIVGGYSVNSSLSSANVYPVGGLVYSITSNDSNQGNEFSFFTTPLDSIVIAKDGSVNSTAPIKRSGNTYTLTGDIVNQTLVVQRDNIVVDGANHSLTGFTRGITYALENMHMENLTGVTIKNLNISYSWQGIYVQNCTNINIEDNTLSNINTGIDVNSANSTTITENTFTNLSTAITYTSFYGFNPSIDNVIFKNNISNVATGITLSFADSNSITDNVIVNSYDPIYADTNATIARNTLINGTDAISVNSYNRIYDNSISGFSESGILLSGVNSTIYQNTVANCSSAVAMGGSSDYFPLGNNTFFQNNFVNNTQPLALYTNSSLSINYWDNGGEGNYWSNYNGADTNKDGVGDSAFQLGDNNSDLYPLMQPYIAQVNSYDHASAQLFFTLAGVAAAGGVFVALTWAYFGKRTVKRKL